MPSNRLSGHTLRSEGKPFVWTANGGRYVRADGHKKEGVGLCSCGAHSQNLDSDGARKRWHRCHKDEIRAKTVATEVPDA